MLHQRSSCGRFSDYPVRLTARGCSSGFVGSFERNVLSSGKRLAEKGVDIGKAEIPEVPLVESAPRYTGGETDEPVPVRLVGGKEVEEAGEGG